MSNFIKRNYTVFMILQSLLVVVWLSNLAMTDAYFSVYALISFLSFFLIWNRNQHKFCESGRCKYMSICLSAVFSLLVILANYPIFTTIGDPALIGRSTSLMVNFINSVLSFTGGICVSYPLISYFLNRFPVHGDEKNEIKFLNPAVIFISFLIVNLIHLFLVEYPGNATEDTFTQISEMISGSYSNFNTFWHTMMFRGILALGYSFFSDLNAAVAVFCVIQIILMAFAFTYCLVTMQQLRVPKFFWVAAYLIYFLIPYNIALSITIWKDVLFACGTLVLLTAWLRILKRVGKNQFLNYLLFCLGSLLYFLSRTNGWLIYFVTAALVFVPLRRNKKFICVMSVMAVIGWVLLNPVLRMLNIAESDIVESLSIPIQQVSRVVADGCEISEEDADLLSHVVDLDEIPIQYVSWLSDPMKEQIREKDLIYFMDHYSEYQDLWIRLGIRHPWTYVKAWVDQTKGYWNGGYDYFLYAETITDNPYGVQKAIGGNPVASLFRLYFGLSRHVIFFEPFHSIGLHIWILALCFVLNLARRREAGMLFVPLFLLVLGLWFGTPVYSCFRYVYPLFVSFPLLVSSTIFSKD